MLLLLQSSLLLWAPGDLGSLPALPLPPGPLVQAESPCPKPHPGLGQYPNTAAVFAARRALIPHIVYSSPEGRGILCCLCQQLEEVFLKLPLAAQLRSSPAIPCNCSVLSSLSRDSLSRDSLQPSPANFSLCWGISQPAAAAATHQLCSLLPQLPEPQRFAELH